MVVSRKFWVPLSAVGLVTFGIGSAANADISDVVFRIQVDAQDGSGRSAFFEHHFDPAYYHDHSYEWTLLAPVEFRDGQGNLMAVLQTASETCHDDPDVNLNFSVVAGSTSMAFTVNSAILGFSTITSPLARASASINGTDFNGDGLVSITPNGVGCYSAYYNAPGPTPDTGTPFTNLLLAGATGGGSTSASDFFPPPLGSMVPIAGAVSNIASQFHFVLSAGDLGGGTSVFHVEVPAPGAVGLLGLAGLLACRRRR